MPTRSRHRPLLSDTCAHMRVHTQTQACARVWTCVQAHAFTLRRVQAPHAHTGPAWGCTHPQDAPGRRPPWRHMASVHGAGRAEACHARGPWATACGNREGLGGGWGSRRCSGHAPPHTRTLTLASTGAVRASREPSVARAEGECEAAATGLHGHPEHRRGSALVTWQPALGHCMSTRVCVFVCCVCAHTWV